MRRIARKIGFVMLAVMVLTIVTATVVSATGNVPPTSLVCIPTDTTIKASWTTVTGATSYSLLYKTGSYPSSPTDGTATTVIITKGFCTFPVSPAPALTAGTTYYIAVWAFDGATYSATPAKMVMTTSMPALAAVTLPRVTAPSTTAQNANISNFNFEPFTGMIAYFNNAQGGLGMPDTSNTTELLVVIGMVALGLYVYARFHNFFAAFGIVFILSVFLTGLHLFQWYAVGIEIVIGAGTWAIEHYYQ